MSPERCLDLTNPDNTPIMTARPTAKTPERETESDQCGSRDGTEPIEPPLAAPVGEYADTNATLATKLVTNGAPRLAGTPERSKIHQPSRGTHSGKLVSTD